jgi:hypothetical protein
VVEETPAGVKTQDGIERPAGLNRLLDATDRCPDQRPGGGVEGTGTGELARREGPFTQRHEGTTRR